MLPQSAGRVSLKRIEYWFRLFHCRSYGVNMIRADVYRSENIPATFAGFTYGFLDDLPTFGAKTKRFVS
jgi:hypothetical protein